MTRTAETSGTPQDSADASRCCNVATPVSPHRLAPIRVDPRYPRFSLSLRAAIPSPLTAVKLSLAFLAAAVLWAVPRGVAAQDFTITEEQFNAWLGNGDPSQAVLAPLESQLRAQIQALDKSCHLTPYQKNKLELAGRGDIARLDSRIGELHDKLVGKTYDRQKLGEVMQDITPLREAIQASVLGEGSLFNKVMRRTLEDSQRAQYDEVQSERGDFRYAAKVRLFVAALDHSVPMRDEQRQALVELLLKTTRRPSRFGQFDWQYVTYQASKAPDKDLAEIFDKPQLEAITRALRQGNRWEPFLRQQGITPAPEPVRKAPVAPTKQDAKQAAAAEKSP